MKLKLLLFFLLFLLVLSIAFAVPLTIKLTPAKSPRGFQAFWDIGFIIVYDIDNLTEDELNKLLVHEYQHQLCWDLFGIYSKDIYDHSKRCFV